MRKPKFDFLTLAVMIECLTAILAIWILWSPARTNAAREVLKAWGIPIP